MRKWTKLEINYMKNCYIHFGYRIAMKQLKRSKKSICRKAESLKLYVDEIGKICRQKETAKINLNILLSERHPIVRRGISIAREGYLYIYKPNHPNATKRRYVLNSHLVMEKHLGRYLTKKEVVHHKNGDVGDDRIENLELYPDSAKHLKHHAHLRKIKKHAQIQNDYAPC